MQNSLKRELSIIAGILALSGYRMRHPARTAMWSATALGLFLSSREPQYSFKRKTAYITGGSRGLGLSLAWNLLERGADVALIARDNEELFRAHELLTKSFPNARILLGKCDITDTNQLQQSWKTASEYLNGIDILINNAGAILVGPFEATDRSDYEAQMRLHLYASIETTKLAVEHFKARGGGKILNICSLGGKIGVPHMSAYDASKFALAGFAQGVRPELALDNITMTTAFPTLMRTGSPIQAVFKGDHEKEFKIFETIDNLPWISISADEAAKQILDAVAEGRSEITLSVIAKARMALNYFFPEILNAITDFVTGLLPRGTSNLRKTGAAIAAPDREVRKEELMYNQKPKLDADFNLGIH